MNINTQATDAPSLDLSGTLQPSLIKTLSERVADNREVDAVSLVEEYIGKSYGRRFFFQIVKTGAPLLVSDIISLVLCFWAGLCMASLLGFPIAAVYSYVFIVLMGAMLITFFMMGLYNGGGMHPIYEFRQTMVSTSLVFVLVAAILVSTSTGLAVLVTYPMLLAVVPLFRSLLRSQLVGCSMYRD